MDTFRDGQRETFTPLYHYSPPHPLTFSLCSDTSEFRSIFLKTTFSEAAVAVAVVAVAAVAVAAEVGVVVGGVLEDGWPVGFFSLSLEMCVVENLCQ